MDRRSEKTFFQGRLTDGQQAHEKMISITNHQGNENLNNSEVVLLLCWGVSSHTCQNDSSKRQEITGVGKDWRKGNPPILLVGI